MNISFSKSRNVHRWQVFQSQATYRLHNKAHSVLHTYLQLLYNIMYLPMTNTEAFAAPNVEHATITGITIDPASPIVLYPNG